LSDSFVNKVSINHLINKRIDNSYQLAVVNYYPIETIELFELIKVVVALQLLLDLDCYQLP